VVPVQGVTPAQLSPTFTDARSEGRVHEAIDIMAPTGTPVLAVADGHVEKLFDSRQGGLTIYQFEPGGRHAYYYAHLDRYAPGLAERQQVRQGQVIGYVGSSGNADPSAPHLHFAVFVLGPEKQWWKGTAIDPYPLFTGRTP
jgi:murein DD-endopeptidase MepM/ murein hydrolase activator NlpD